MKKTEGQVAFFPMPKSERKPRTLPIDAIFCSARPSRLEAHLAHDAGWIIGVGSIHWEYETRPHLRPLWETRFKIDFLDNEWKDYDHAVHMAAVKECQPKYATVKDLESEDDFDETMDMAKEIGEYAEWPIVIPKVDVIDKIPERYVIGYSVPSSYGQTNIPVERFRGRRVHLLGGTWGRQRALIAQLGHSVVSLDQNHIMMISKYGQFVHADGTSGDLSSYGLIPFNQIACCIALSFGNISNGLKHMQALKPMREERDGDLQGV